MPKHLCNSLQVAPKYLLLSYQNKIVIKGTTLTKGKQKGTVENLDGLLDNMASALRHHLIKAESPNLQVNYSSSVHWVLLFH